MQPGALPALEDVSLMVDSLQTTLPASWGSRADVLPALAELALKVGRLMGPLPPQWANGFAGLRRLEIKAAHISAAGVSAYPLQLPPEWAHGFRSLDQLAITLPGLAGSIPPEWLQVGCFPKLESL